MNTEIKKDPKIEHLLDLAEIAFPDMPEGKRELFRFLLYKAKGVGIAEQIEAIMSEQRRIRTELALLRVAKWKLEKQINN